MASLLAEALFPVFADGRKDSLLPSANTRKRASANRETNGQSKRSLPSGICAFHLHEQVSPCQYNPGIISKQPYFNGSVQVKAMLGVCPIALLGLVNETHIAQSK